MEQQGCADMAPPDENRMKATVEKVKKKKKMSIDAYSYMSNI